MFSRCNTSRGTAAAVPVASFSITSLNNWRLLLTYTNTGVATTLSKRFCAENANWERTTSASLCPASQNVTAAKTSSAFKMFTPTVLTVTHHSAASRHPMYQAHVQVKVKSLPCGFCRKHSPCTDIRGNKLMLLFGICEN